MQPAAQRDDWDRALEGLVFPAAKDLIIRTARDRGGIDSEVHAILGRLPRESYESLEELLADIRAAYESSGFNRDALPV